MSKELIRRAVEAAERAETPFILFPEDLALRLRLSVGYVRDAIRDGWLGPWLTIEGEPVVTRDSLKEHLKIRMSQRSDADRELLPPTPVNGMREEG